MAGEPSPVVEDAYGLPGARRIWMGYVGLGQALAVFAFGLAASPAAHGLLLGIPASRWVLLVQAALCVSALSSSIVAITDRREAAWSRLAGFIGIIVAVLWALMAILMGVVQQAL